MHELININKQNYIHHKIQKKKIDIELNYYDPEEVRNIEKHLVLLHLLKQIDRTRPKLYLLRRKKESHLEIISHTRHYIYPN